jgi:hypothetical protein
MRNTCNQASRKRPYQTCHAALCVCAMHKGAARSTRTRNSCNQRARAMQPIGQVTSNTQKQAGTAPKMTKPGNLACKPTQLKQEACGAACTTAMLQWQYSTRKCAATDQHNQQCMQYSKAHVVLIIAMQTAKQEHPAKASPHGHAMQCMPRGSDVKEALPPSAKQTLQQPCIRTEGRPT